MEPICLVTPPSVFLLDERVFPHLGILKVGAVLEASGHEVDVLDLSGIGNFTEAAEDYARSGRASTFGITATTPQLPAAAETIKAIRRGNPSARVILGGPHVTLVASAAKRERERGVSSRATQAFGELAEIADVLVAGDGEGAIFHAISGQDSFIDADDPKSALFLTGKQLEELPLPARHLIDMSSYHYTIDGVQAASLIAQLGCPFQCGFCGGRLSPSLRRVRTRSPEHVVREIEHLNQVYGFQGFMMYDDELNVNREMVRLMNLIRDAQRKVGQEWRLRGFIKSQLFTDEQAAAMYEAGFRWILVGFESGSPRILDNIRKMATEEENTRCVEIARRHGLKVKALMSIGHPGESRETIAATRDWLLKVRPDDFDATVITTYPGTPYYDDAVRVETPSGEAWMYQSRNGDRLYAQEVDYRKVAEYYKGDPDGGYKAYVFTDHLSSTEIVEERDALERTVREELGIPFNPSRAAMRYEHSMGQPGMLPSNILRSSNTSQVPL